MKVFDRTATVMANGHLALDERIPELIPGQQVHLVISLLEPARAPAEVGTAEVPPAEPRRLRLDWAGGLRELQQKYTSVELQHQASEWWSQLSACRPPTPDT